MELEVKTFDELTARELYDILALRVNVFVVEQNCPYDELDYRDLDAVHVWLREEDEILAYLRVLKPGVESEYAALGRVVSRKRRSGIGSKILQAGIRTAQEVFHAEKIYLEAQTYAIPFYERQGFEVVSGEFMVDGIPHVKMIRENQ